MKRSILLMQMQGTAMSTRPTIRDFAAVYEALIGCRP